MNLKYGVFFCSILFFTCSGGNSLTTLEIDGTMTEVSSKVSKGDSIIVKMTSYHENGEISIIKNYKNGVPHGKWLWFNEEGGRDTLRLYKDSLLNGKSRAWHVNGEVFYDKEFKNGKKTGVWRSWYDDKKNRSLSEYNEDLLHGTVAEWYSNGVLSKLTHYSEGKRNGTASKWSPKGKLIAHRVFIEDIPHVEIFWHDSSELSKIVAYREGEKSWHINWDQYGRRLSKPLHDKHFIFRERNKLGGRKVESDFIGEKKHGVEIQWHDNGRISIIQVYVRNRIIYERKMNEKGKFQLETVSLKGKQIWNTKTLPKIPS
tara:strand:+ start:26481 stop:27428 length:948 start_codon:yes stop_codon:yes gene_type:complete